MLSRLHCRFEAQDAHLCDSVAQQFQHGLDLSNITLTPSDCLCIGYFLLHVCRTAIETFKVNLHGCSIGDQGCKCLVHCLNECFHTHSAVTTRFQMYLSKNFITHCGVCHLSTLLKVGCIEYLGLGMSISSLDYYDRIKVISDIISTKTDGNNLGSLQGMYGNYFWNLVNCDHALFLL